LPRVTVSSAAEVSERWGSFGPQSRPEAFAQGFRGQVLDLELRPLRAATVWLVPVSGAAFARAISMARGGGPQDPPIVRASVDGRGRFTIGVPEAECAERFDLCVVAEGMCDKQLPSVQAQPGIWRDLGSIRMEKGYDVTGKVVRKAGKEPIAGAEVSVLSYERRGQASFVPGREHGTTVRTDAAGEYRIRGVAIRATCDLGAAAPGFARAERLAVHLQRAGENRYDFELEPGGEIAGQVLDRRGAAVPAARIRAVGCAGKPDVELLAWSDAQGRFRLLGVPLQDQRIAIEHAAYAGEQVSPVPPGTRDLTVVLRKLGSVRVMALDAQGGWLREFLVRMRTETADPNALDGTGDALRSVRVAADGFAELPLLGPSERRRVIEVQAKDHAPGYSEPLTLGLDEAPQIVRVQLDAGGGIAGEVFGADRAPLAGVLVTTLPAVAGDDPFTWRAVTRMPTKLTEQHAKTDAQGWFRLGGLYPGRYVLRFSEAGHCERTCEGIVVRRGETTLLGGTHLLVGTLLWGTVSFVGQVPAFTKVTVSTHAEGPFVCGAPVYGEAIVAKDGSFAISRRLPPGRYRVSAGPVPQPEPFLPLMAGVSAVVELGLDGTQARCKVALEVRGR